MVWTPGKFSAAELVGNPLALLAGIVQIKHGSHGVHPQSVSVVLVQPVAGAADQKAAYLVASVIEDITVPVRVVALPGVGVLI
jgi:hypothetical protein